MDHGSFRIDPSSSTSHKSSNSEVIVVIGDWMFEVSKLNGKKVITTDAFNVGEVSEAMMDTDWKITHIHVNLTKEATKELGFKKPVLGHITICLPVDHIKGFADVITLNKTREELKGIPECKSL
jgi:sporulation protein YlmC with PRC-barrel domain